MADLSLANITPNKNPQGQSYTEAFLRVRAIPRENIFQPLVLTTFEFARAHEGGSVFQVNCTMALF